MSFRHRVLTVAVAVVAALPVAALPVAAVSVIAVSVTAVSVAALSVTAQPASAQIPAPLTAADRKQVVDSLASTLVGRYVFPEVGTRVAADLKARLSKGEYDGLSDGVAFADKLTADMHAIAHDGHLNVRWSDGTDNQLNEHPTADERARRELWARTRNYGFDKLERLSGNVGYLELRGFMPADQMRQTAIAAMRFLGNSDAIIIELRRNGGGEPEAVALLTSWFFPKGKKVHLNDLWWRDGNRTEQFFTDPKLDVPRFTGPVYVLTSSRTFSAAEEFTYNLKQLKRATQVGGGANPGEGVQLSANFGVFMPTGRAINPITHDNWEGKGNVPEIATSADDALKTAHRAALQALLAKTTNPDLRQGYAGALEQLGSR
jgi:hypothetical protein